MPNLDEILQQTMLWKAGRGHAFHKFPFSIQEPSPLDPGIEVDVYGLHVGTVDSDLIVAKNAVWKYRSPVFSARDGAGVVRVEQVQCCVRDMKYMAMPVFEEIEWGPVKISSPELGREVELPLTVEFLIRKNYIPQGRIEDSDSGFWRLEAEVDQSWELVFGYEIPLFSSTTPVPMKEAAWNDSNLMEPPEAMVCPHPPGQNHFNTLSLRPLRVVICISLVCCKERRDFDPGSLFGGGRIYPLILAISSLPLDRLTGAVRLARPERGGMNGNMGPERMTSEIGTYLFTDRNFPPPKIPPPPFWDNLFDYFLLDPYPGEYEVVSPGRCGRRLRNATKVPASFVEWSWRDVSKVPRQGEFDNIHFAPKMIVPDDIIALNPSLTGMDRVTMAPFCVHDCLHLHWRWGSGDDAKWNKGWSDDQTPYSQAGAPLVPANQKVTLKLLSPVACLYKAETQNVAAGEWQVIMHHGAAYALAAGAMADLVMSLLSTASDHIAGARPNWALFYWYLRNTFYGSTQVPRLKWDSGKLDALRAL
jgi:hypothetical protein